MKNIVFNTAMIAAMMAGELAFASPAAAALVGLYQFNDSSNIGLDTSGLGNNLITSGTGALYTSAGLDGGGLSLNGSSTLTTLSGNVPNQFPLGGSSFTIAFDFKTTNNGGFIGWGAYNNPGLPGQSNAIRTGNGDQVDGFFWYGDIAGGSNVENGTWQQVVESYDGTTRDLYLNGALVATDNPATPNVQNENFTIGNSCCGNYFTGSLDNVAVFNVALTPTEVNSQIAAIPEPATWAMMLVGMGMIGFAARRRQNVSVTFA